MNSSIPLAEIAKEVDEKNPEILKYIDELDKTGIENIDDMLKYMQIECIKNKIDFILVDDYIQIFKKVW